VLVSLAHSLADWDAPDRGERTVFEAGPVTDAALLRALVADDRYLPVDCGLADSFEEAVGRGRARSGAAQ
jgi:hypothetical protein